MAGSVIAAHIPNARIPAMQKKRIRQNGKTGVPKQYRRCTDKQNRSPCCFNRSSAEGKENSVTCFCFIQFLEAGDMQPSPASGVQMLSYNGVSNDRRRPLRTLSRRRIPNCHRNPCRRLIPNCCRSPCRCLSCFPTQYPSLTGSLIPGHSPFPCWSPEGSLHPRRFPFPFRSRTRCGHSTRYLARLGCLWILSVLDSQ
ncbi:MAG: hypothetical protein K0S45_1931 [Nitrospira sp.]|nr:hypothetical protein [Nitrospira sp.]